MLGAFGKVLRAIASGPDPARIPAPSEVIPTLVLGSWPDWDWSMDRFRFGGYAYEAAGAGARSQVGLYNPAGSGVCAVVEGIECVSPSSYVMLRLVEGLSTFDSDGNERAMDTRAMLGTTINKRPTCQVVSDTAAVIGDIISRLTPIAYDGAANFTYRLDQPFILFPDATVITATSADNTNNTTMFYWTERAFDEEEIRGTRQGQFD